MANLRIPAPIRPLLEKYLSQTARELPGLLSSFYIVGSIALDGFNERFSDVDFVAVLSRKASPGELETLRTIHKTIEQDSPKWKMSGSYLQLPDLGRSKAEIEPHPYYHDGKLHQSGSWELNPVTWWELKNRGITLLGPEPAELPFSVDQTWLRSWMKNNLNTYWSGWTRRLDGFLVLLSDWGIQWTVLGVLRQYYTFQENSITTKTKAAEYALAHLPERWHPIIREAVSIREGKIKTHFRSRITRLNEAVKFLQYVIQISNGPARTN